MLATLSLLGESLSRLYGAYLLVLLTASQRLLLLERANYREEEVNRELGNIAKRKIYALKLKSSFSI